MRAISRPGFPRSTINLLLSAALLALIAGASRADQDGRARQWRILAWIFLGLSIDEVAMIHELIGEHAVPMLIDTGRLTSSFFHYHWVVAGIAAVLIVGISFLPLLFSLPIRTRLLFILAAGLFVGGGLGVEMISAHFDSGPEKRVTAYAISTAIEELLEMVGIAVFNYALADYLTRSREGSEWRLVFTSAPIDQEAILRSNAEGSVPHQASAAIKPESEGMAKR